MSRRPLTTDEIEDTLCGMATLGDRRFWAEAIVSRLTPDNFTTPRGRTLWAAILELRAQGADVRLDTLAQALRTAGTLDGIGGPLALASLTDLVHSGLDWHRLADHVYHRAKP